MRKNQIINGKDHIHTGTITRSIDNERAATAECYLAEDRSMITIEIKCPGGSNTGVFTYSTDPWATHEQLAQLTRQAARAALCRVKPALEEQIKDMVQKRLRKPAQHTRW